MRRVLTFLTAIVLLLVSSGLGVFTADLPFWRRALQLPLPADGAYLPVATIGSPDRAPVKSPSPRRRLRRPGGRGVGESRARRRFARLVSHVSRPARGRALFPGRRRDDAAAGGAGGATARRRWRSASRSPTARIASLDTPVARYLPEWDDEPRGRITLRQLLEETSGLETGGDIRGLLYRSPWENLARPAGVRHRPRRAHVVRQRFRIERARLQARARAGRLLQRFAGQHATRRGHRRTRHRHAVRDLMSTSACGARSARAARSCSSIGAPACRPRIAAGARRRATCCAS